MPTAFAFKGSGFNNKTHIFVFSYNIPSSEVSITRRISLQLNCVARMFETDANADDTSSTLPMVRDSNLNIIRAEKILQIYSPPVCDAIRIRSLRGLLPKGNKQVGQLSIREPQAHPSKQTCNLLT